MAKNELEKKDFGTVFFNWNFPEHGTNWRNKKWYKWASLAGILLLVLSLLTGNILFTIIIILAGVIFFFQSNDPPLTVNAQISESGIKVGKRFYDYRDLDRFWIIYEPPEIKNLYIEFKNFIRPRLGIPVQNENVIELRKKLLEYLPEDVERENEPLSDGLARWLQMH